MVERIKMLGGDIKVTLTYRGRDEYSVHLSTPVLKYDGEPANPMEVEGTQLKIAYSTSIGNNWTFALQPMCIWKLVPTTSEWVEVQCSSHMWWTVKHAVIEVVTRYLGDPQRCKRARVECLEDRIEDYKRDIQNTEAELCITRAALEDAEADLKALLEEEE